MHMQIVSNMDLKAIDSAERAEEALELIQNLDDTPETVVILYLLDSILDDLSIDDVEDPLNFKEVCTTTCTAIIL